ncbi:GerAB/ArcD/ProY family transporter [Thalassobacillus devorans]|uniref:GerAB/ArcD/ProY family transporter n=1 Tax=Thalassobacillus devorans TaxID=279813 RepID=UPI00048B3635|nr:endospore germination permease [Thalassobacillus devorans]
MKNFNYSDENIYDRDILIAIPSMVIAVATLFLPRELASVTIALDGILALLIGGSITILITWMIVKLASRFPQQSFLTYTSLLINKPIAVLLTCFFIWYGILVVSYEVRAIATISHLYLFDKTPIEVIALNFLLVVVYAVSGSRSAIFRLNALFFPIIILIAMFVTILSFRFVVIDNIYPILQTDVKGYIEATKKSVISLSGYGQIGFLLFYISLIRNPVKTPGKAVFGMSSVIGINLLIYTMCITVFGNLATSNLMFPTIELARTVEFPGGFFNRFESLFFVVWTIAIFTTSVIAFDAAVMGLQSLLPKVNKLKFVFFLSPCIYFLSSLPKHSPEVGDAGRLIGTYGLTLTVTVTIILWIIYIVRK